MFQGFNMVRNDIDNAGPIAGTVTGGFVDGTGLQIRWQNGPLIEGGLLGEPDAPNGAFVEDVVMAAMQRLQVYQKGPHTCAENKKAISKLQQALVLLDQRSQRRTKEGVEGTHELDSKSRTATTPPHEQSSVFQPDSKKS